MDPNEWGDFLAGTLGPLALVWVVLSFFLQSAELRASVEALTLQSEELRGSVEAQNKLWKTTQDGLDFERKKHFQTELEEKRRSLPKFSVNYESSSKKADGRSVYLFKASNHGGYAAEVNLVAIEPDQAQATAGQTRGFTAPEVSWNFAIHAPTGLIFRNGVSLKVMISSISPDGVSRDQVFEVRAEGVVMNISDTSGLDPISDQ